MVLGKIVIKEIILGFYNHYKNTNQKNFNQSEFLKIAQKSFPLIPNKMAHYLRMLENIGYIEHKHENNELTFHITDKLIEECKKIEKEIEQALKSDIQKDLKNKEQNDMPFFMKY